MGTKMKARKKKVGRAFWEAEKTQTHRGRRMQVHCENCPKKTHGLILWFTSRSVHLFCFVFCCICVRGALATFFLLSFLPPILHWSGSSKGAAYLIITWKAFACIRGCLSAFCFIPRRSVIILHVTFISLAERASKMDPLFLP